MRRIMVRLCFARLIQLVAMHVFACYSLPSLDGVYGDEPAFERFSFNREGTYVTLPITIEGTRHCFIVDTGASLTCYSTDLRKHLGEVVVQGSGITALGAAEFPLHHAPDATIGRLPLHRPEELVCCLDLQGLGRGMESPIGGIVGMAFLRRHIIELDFDEGTVAMLRQLPDVKMAEYTRIGLALDRNGSPLVTCEVAGRRHVAMVDTGFDYSGHLDFSLVDRLIETRSVAWSGAALVGGARGKEVLKLVRSPFSIADFKHSDLVFTSRQDGDDPTDHSRIGIRYLQRFRVLLDFPKRNIYLRKSKRYGFRDHSHLYGMQVGGGGRLRVLHVYNNSPAHRLGIRRGDVIASVDGISTSNLPYSKVLRLIGMRDKPLRLEVVREGRSFEVGFPLDL